VFKVTEKDDYIILNHKGIRMQDVSTFIQKVNELYADGFKLEEGYLPRECPKIPIALNLRFIKDDSKVKVDNLESLHKKKDLLEYAKGHGLEVPDEIDRPKGIKKYIKDNLINKDNK
jgi:hypothetical protein